MKNEDIRVGQHVARNIGPHMPRKGYVQDIEKDPFGQMTAVMLIDDTGWIECHPVELLLLCPEEEQKEV